MFNIKELTKDLSKNIKLLGEKVVVKELISPKPGFPLHPQIKLKVLLTTSILKMRLLSIEILDLTKSNRFFVSMATLRMMVEELIFITFVLSKIEKAKDLETVDNLITKATVGRRTRSSPGLLPFNIMTTLEEAEKYFRKNFKKLVGMLDDIYTFISDYVHPNAPSRYYFFENQENKIKFVYRYKASNQDIGMILNYACMTLEMYTIIWARLEKIKLKKTK